MKKIQRQLKHLREKKKLTVSDVANKINSTIQIIEILEGTRKNNSSDITKDSLQNYYHRYGMCLGIPKRKIAKVLEKIDCNDFKKFCKSEKNIFDYINSIIILVLVIMLFGQITYMVANNRYSDTSNQDVVILEVQRLYNTD